MDSDELKLHSLQRDLPGLCVSVWAPDNEDGDDTNDTDDLATIKADGSDPNGAYSWEIVDGADKVELLDAAMGAAPIPALFERAGASDADLWIGVKIAFHTFDQRSPLVRQVTKSMLDAQRLLPPPLNDEEKAERDLIEQRLTEFLKTPELRRPTPGPIVHVSRESSLVSNE